MQTAFSLVIFSIGCTFVIHTTVNQSFFDSNNTWMFKHSELTKKVENLLNDLISKKYFLCTKRY